MGPTESQKVKPQATWLCEVGLLEEQRDICEAEQREQVGVMERRGPCTLWAKAGNLGPSLRAVGAT